MSKRSISRLGTTRILAASSALLLTAGSTHAEDLKVWSGFPEMAPFYERVAAELMQQHPDLNITVEAIPLREHEKRIALGVSSGSAGNVIIELANSTATRYLENELFNPAPAPVAEFVTGDGNFSDFFSQGASYQDTVFGVPLFRGQGALFYNTDMFESAGLDAPPATMADYTDYATKLTQRDANGNPEVSGWSLRLSGGGQGIAEKFWINMFQFGGNLVEPAGDGKWQSGVNTEAGLQAFNQYVENVHAQKNVSVEMPADAEAFERQQTAMFIRESWVIGDIAKKSPDLNYATAPLPRGSIALAVNLYVKAEGDAESAAWEFTQMANEPEQLNWMLENIGWLPNRANVDYSAVIEKAPAFAAFMNYPADYEFFTLPAISPVEEVLSRVAAALTDAFADESLAGNSEAQKAILADVDDDINKILKREGLLAD